MSEIRFTKDHEWVQLINNIATVGITLHAQEALGDIVYVELPELYREVESGDACSVVESVKAASDVYAPLSGKVIEVNQNIVDDPSLVNSDPLNVGWVFKLELNNVDAFFRLMTEIEYIEYLKID